jgi:hypothetical protein
VNQTEIERKLLPTPANQTQSGGVRLEGGAGGRKRMKELGLLPTPTREDYGSQSYPDDPTRKRPHLRAFLPTPTKRDERADEWSPAYERRKSLSIDALSSKHGRDGTAGLLRLVEWMMGYPRRWLLDAALGVPASPPTATPSSRRSPKR